MEFDFYLSEMSVSDHHGGGLTLQRVIDDALLKIKYFAYVSRFAYDHPANSKFVGRDIDLTTMWESDFVRSVIGRSLAFNINKHPFVIEQAAKKNARLLNLKLKKNELITGLICPQGLASIYTLEKLKKYRQIKYVSWVMDDHLVNYIDGKWCYPGKTERIFKKHLLEAEHVFVISHAMRDFYQERFGINATVLFGPADFDIANKPRSKSIPLGFKIGYFGAVAAWQIDALVKIKNALNGTGIVLDIYSNIQSLPRQLESSNVQLQGNLIPAKVLQVMANYYAVVLPMSFLPQMRNMSEFNIATKMSEYLASRVPILAIGPKNAAMIKYLKINKAAIIIESGREEDVKTAFELLRNELLINEILDNAEMLVNTETGTLAMRKRWYAVINSLTVN